MSALLRRFSRLPVDHARNGLASRQTCWRAAEICHRAIVSTQATCVSKPTEPKACAENDILLIPHNYLPPGLSGNHPVASRQAKAGDDGALVGRQRTAISTPDYACV